MENVEQLTIKHLNAITVNNTKYFLHLVKPFIEELKNDLNNDLIIYFYDAEALRVDIMTTQETFIKHGVEEILNKLESYKNNNLLFIGSANAIKLQERFYYVF